MPSNPLTQSEINDYTIGRILTPSGELNPYMPSGYFLATHYSDDSPALWRLFDASYIRTGTIDPNRLGTGATNLGNLYLADDGTWKNIGGGGGGDMLKATYDIDDDGVVDAAETIRIIVRNSTGSTLTKGKVVYLSGATGNRPNALLAQANSEMTSSKTIGIVVSDIPDNSDGYVAVSGTLHDLDTFAFADGVAVWLSPTVAGDWTTTVPSEPNHSVFIGYIARSHPSQGRLVIAIQNGYELNELHNVVAPSPLDNDLLRYNNTAGYWENQSIASIFGGTPLTYIPTLDQVTTAGNITTNAVTVGGLTVATNLIYTDTVNGRVGIGTTSPTRTLTVNGPIVIPNNSAYYTKATSGSELSVFKADTSNNIQIGSVFFGGGQINYTSTYFDWYNYPSSVVTHRMRLTSSGNLLIGTTTDAGYKLDVNGTTRTTGLIVNTDLIYTDLTSNAVIIGATSLTNAFNKFEVRDTGTTGVVGRLEFRNDNNSYTYLHVTSNNVGFSLGAHSGGAGYITANQGLNFTSNHSTNNATVWLGNSSRLSLSNSAATVRYLTVSTAGNLIIGGSTDAGHKLDVLGNIRATSAIDTYSRIESTATGSAGTIYKNIYREYFTGTNYATANSWEVYDITSSASRIHISGATGNVAINQTLAVYKLDVEGDIRSTTGAYFATTSGSVGIGTMTPIAKLDVAGDINTSGVFAVGGVIGWTGTINIPLNPAGQQNIQVVGGIITNVF